MCTSATRMSGVSDCRLVDGLVAAADGDHVEALVHEGELDDLLDGETVVRE